MEFTQRLRRGTAPRRCPLETPGCLEDVLGQLPEHGNTSDVGIRGRLCGCDAGTREPAGQNLFYFYVFIVVFVCLFLEPSDDAWTWQYNALASE